MKKSITLSAFFALLLLAAAPQARAQQDISIGPRVGYDIGGDFESLFIGADARIGLAALPIRINPTFDYYFLDQNDFGCAGADDAGVDCSASLMQITANALYELGIDNTTFTPYAGAGLSYLRSSYEASGNGGSISESNSDTALNLLGGAEFTEVNGFVPFAQAEFVLGGDADLFKITGGILFNI